MARQNVTQKVSTATATPAESAAIEIPEPGRRLLDLVRGKFVIKSSSLNRWCAENGVSRHAALACLTGASKNDDAVALRARLVSAAGITQGEN